MGFPLSSLQQLSLLCEREPEERRFDRYKLVAVLVAGPKDGAVKDAMARNFERLDISTGKDFAFITFMEPPIQWKQLHGYRMDSLQGLSEGFSTDEGRMISALRELFHLPESPCLMLTDSLNSNQYAIIPVKERDLVEKMEDIGKYAEQRHGRFPITDSSLGLFLSHFGPVYIEQTEDGNSIERNIADIRAIDSLLYNTGEYKEGWSIVRRDAQKWVRKKLQELSFKVKSAKENYEAFLKRYSDYLALTLQTVEPTVKTETQFPSVSLDWDLPPVLGYITPNAFSQEKPREVSFYEQYLIPDKYASYLTPYSQKKMNGYNHTARYFIQGVLGNDSGYPSFIPAPDDDFATLGYYMGHIVEEEINASVVQLFRKCAGIQMPTYYRVWDDTHDKILVLKNEKGTLFLNGKYERLPDGRYSDNTITIGQTPPAIRQMKIDYPEYPFGPFGEESFISRIAGFARYRNKADHPGLYSFEYFKTAHKAFMAICEEDLPHIAHLKKQLTT